MNPKRRRQVTMWEGGITMEGIRVLELPSARMATSENRSLEEFDT